MKLLFNKDSYLASTFFSLKSTSLSSWILKSPVIYWELGGKGDSKLYEWVGVAYSIYVGYVLWETIPFKV